jgi:C-terminal processing protease CtpA/Prc
LRGLLLIGLIARSAGAAALPEFDEVSGLVRSNLAGATPAQLNDLAVKGFLNELAPRVTLVESNSALMTNHSPRGILESRIYRETVGYVRLGLIEAGIGEALHARYLDLAGSNQLTGLVLDLRRAEGDDYAAALAVADLFLTQEQPLVNWGQGLKRSTDKDQAITLPTAVLVNGQTGGSAEALAAMMRQSGVALIIGTRTSGTAGIQRDFPLMNGQMLRITVANIQLGDAQMLPTDGLKPDVEVVVNPTLEEAVLTGSVDSTQSEQTDGESETNAELSRLRLNEADLVRRWRGEMLSAEDASPALAAAPESRDPALLRALDLMEGLAILRSWQK